MIRASCHCIIRYTHCIPSNPPNNSKFFVALFYKSAGINIQKASWAYSNIISNQKSFKHGNAKKGGKKSATQEQSGKKRTNATVEGSDESTIVDTVDDLISLSELNQRYERVLEGLNKDLSVIRGGRIDPAMFDHLTVHSYGQDVPLSTVAQVSVKGPQLLVLTCYDLSLAPFVDEAVRNSGMSLNPQIEGNKVSVPIPKMSQETRESLIKLASKSTEKAKVHMRGIRHKVLETLKNSKDLFSADDVYRHQKEIDKLTSTMEAACTKALESKKKEILMPL